MRVKCLAQEYNAMTWPGLDPGPLNPESSALTTGPSCLPHQDMVNNYFFQVQSIKSISHRNMMYMYLYCMYFIAMGK